MNRKVYFGNATKQLWVPAPQSGLAASTNGFVSENVLLSGRGSLRRSKASHRSFSASWIGSMNADAAEDSLHTIKDFSDGLYGDGPFYWLDPYAIDTNLLPPHWAAPMLSASGWPSLCDAATASLVATEANARNYPTQSLRLTFGASIAEGTQVATIIIPSDHRLHFGWHGEQNSGDATVALRAYDRDTGAPTDIEPAVLAVTALTRTNTQLRGSDYSRVEVLIKNPTASTSQIDIAGMIAQVLPEGGFVETGDFISGRGTSALEFAELPQIEYYSARVNNGQIGMSARFLEI